MARERPEGHNAVPLERPQETRNVSLPFSSPNTGYPDKLRECSRDNKISALEAKLAALDAEQQERESSREASTDLGEGPSSKPITKAARDLDNLPKKPSSDVIATGEKLELQDQERKQGEDRLRSHGKGTGIRRTAAEAPKSTLASLGAGFSRDG
jgi:hypothetical protein